MKKLLVLIVFGGLLAVAAKKIGISISMPTARIAVTDICVIRLERFRGVRKIESVAQ
jgi:hypothetical protein